MNLEQLIKYKKNPTFHDILESKRINNLKVVKNPVIQWNHIRQRNGEWEVPEYDFMAVERFADIESYLSISFQKKHALFIKEGWELVGEKPENIAYVQKRLDQIASVSKTSLTQLISEIAINIIKFSNSIIGVVRSDQASGGYSYIDPLTKKRVKPIAALYSLPMTTIEVKTNENKQPVRFRQYLFDSVVSWKDYDLENIIHFHVNKKDGFIFGTPRVLPVLEDIKALRRIEENVELLTIQSLFPLIQYKVGTPERPARVLPDGTDEIELVTAQIEGAPPEGIYVTSDRHELKMIGSEGRALRVESYLTYFKKRVISGLGLSSIDIGEGDTANRSTAASLSRSLIDAIKADQKIVETVFLEKIIKPILLEARNGSINIEDPSNLVYLKFKEIDYDSQIKKNNDVVQKWVQSVITHQEMRKELGYNQIDKGEESQLYYQKVGQQQMEVASELKVQEGKALASVKGVINKNSPENQYGKKSSSSKSIKDSIRRNSIIEDNLIKATKTVIKDKFDLNKLKMVVDAKFNNLIKDRFFEGFYSETNAISDFNDLEKDLLLAYRNLKNHSKKYVDKLFLELETGVNDANFESKVNSIGYRLDVIYRTESQRAYNWGTVCRLKKEGIDKYRVVLNGDSSLDKQILLDKTWDVASATIANIPPWHPNSNVKVVEWSNE